MCLTPAFFILRLVERNARIHIARQAKTHQTPQNSQNMLRLYLQTQESAYFRANVERKSSLKQSSGEQQMQTNNNVKQKRTEYTWNSLA